MSDVAKLAGVSTMTVSRVLNEKGNVTEETRVRVMAAVEKMQYRPNEIARSLREQKSRQIGILIPNLYDPFFAACAHAIGLVAKSHSFSVVLSTTDEDASIEYDEASRMMRRNVDGLIVIPVLPRKGSPGLKDREFEHMPMVAIDRPLEGSRCDRLLVQNKQGALCGVQHLLQIGHTGIAFFGLATPLYTLKMRQQGYEAAMHAAGLRTNISLVSDAREDTLAALRKALSSRTPPTAIFGSNNLVTRHLLHSMYALGLHAPDPIALVGFDDFETAELMRPGITVVRQPSESLGRLAAEILFSRLTKNAPDPRPRRVMLPVELVVRGSCGARV